jgi:aspartate/methionine/tyrosine aminotransferase
MVGAPFLLAKLLARTGVARLLPSVREWTNGGGAFVHYYSDQVLAAPHVDLGEAGKFLDRHGPDIIDLSQSAPSFDLVPSASTKLPADRRGWPPAAGLPELRQAVANKLQADQQLAVNPADEVLITAGGAGGWNVALDTFVNRGGRVVLFDPTSPLYPFTLRQRRARIRWLPTTMEEGRLRFPLDALAKAMRWATMIVVTSPANPTGGCIGTEDLHQIAWWADRHDVLIVNDDAFERYRYEGSAPSIATLPKAQRRTLTLGSVSKGHALASTRVGWLAGHRHLVRPCLLSAALHTPFVPTVCQQIALAALRQGDEVFGPFKKELESRRRYAFERLQALGLKPVWPAGGFFLWMPIEGGWGVGPGAWGANGQAFAEHLYQARRVLLWPGCFFGPSGQGYVRLSFAGDDGRLREGLARLADFLRELKTERDLVPAHVA